MSPLNLGLFFVSLLSVVVYYNALVGNPVIAGRALIRFYRLSASTRQGSKAREACRQWWSMAMVPVYVLTALLLIGYLGAGQ